MMLLFFVDVDEIWTQVSSWSCCKIFKLNIGQYWTSCFGTCRLVECTLTMAPSWDLSYHNWIGCIAFSWTPKWATNPIRPPSRVAGSESHDADTANLKPSPHPLTAVCAGILRLSILFWNQFSTVYLATVGPNLMILADLHENFIPIQEKNWPSSTALRARVTSALCA